MDQIGTFKGKAISTMTREELLDFAAYAMAQFEAFKAMEEQTRDYRIKREVAPRTMGKARPQIQVCIGLLVAALALLSL